MFAIVLRHAPVMPSAITTAAAPRSPGCGGDVAIVARHIPLFPVERTMQIAPVAEARDRTATRIGWAAIFMKAYAIVARETPVLRTWLARGLFGLRPVTASASVATLAVNRVEAGGDRLFFARLHEPEALPLPEIQRFIDDRATLPVEDIFKRQLQLEMLPAFVRRTLLQWNMGLATPKRATRLGTFSLSTLAGMGAVNRFHPTICSTSLSYGPLDADGRCLVTLIADHRVLDGAAAARALQTLERVLLADIVAELTALRGDRAAPPQAAA